MMAAVRSKDTKPEMTVRRLVHGAGYRYRLHRKELPGRPDLVFVSKRKIILVNGCFWHQHGPCVASHLPRANREYWIPKLEANKKRDMKNLRALRRAGWKCLVIWECQIKGGNGLGRILKFLEN
jgi:DNA mismatch endonuclease (patch repair protein)